MGEGLSSWRDVVNHPVLNIQERYRETIINSLNGVMCLDGTVYSINEDLLKTAYFKRLLEATPCLYSQLNVKVTARAIVHLCEVTLNERITSQNVYDAFEIQHPGRLDKSFAYSPVINGAGGGDIMEQLCSEVLSNHGIPHMEMDEQQWPVWNSRSHLSLNSGKMSPLKLYGDILIPSAPNNLMISVKSESARERFVISGNRLESVGFGFFNDPSEFWTQNRINLLKRWGFSAVYMPMNTLDAIEVELRRKGLFEQSININGKPLYRPLEMFGDDMSRVAGKLSMNL